MVINNVLLLWVTLFHIDFAVESETVGDLADSVPAPEATSAAEPEESTAAPVQ